MIRNHAKHEFWKAKISKWLASGLSITNWCQNEGVSYETFYYWRKKLSASEKALPIETSNPFIEVSDKPRNTGIVLECQGVFIHLSPDFDPITLRSCLEVLQRLSC